MLGDLDLSMIAARERSERTSFESQRSSFESRPSLDRSATVPQEHVSTLRRYSTNSISEPDSASSLGSSWGFLGSSPASSSFKEHFLSRYESLPKVQPGKDKVHPLLRTLSKGLDQFR